MQWTKKSFEVVRIKTNGTSVHTVYTESKEKAWGLVWPDDKKQIGRFVRAL